MINRKPLTRKQKQCVRDWLDLESQKNECPFSYIKNMFCLPKIYEVCYNWFDRSATAGHCPCSMYPLETVKRYARKMIESAPDGGANSHP